MKRCIEKTILNVESYKDRVIEPFHFSGPGLVYKAFVELEPHRAGLDAPIGIVNTSFGRMLVLSWFNHNAVGADNIPVFMHKRDTCYPDYEYWTCKKEVVPWVATY